jgi:hypothetical protein
LLKIIKWTSFQKGGKFIAVTLERNQIKFTLAFCKLDHFKALELNVRNHETVLCRGYTKMDGLQEPGCVSPISH